MPNHDEVKVGLCARCAHARIVDTPRSRFWRCALAAHDPRFEKYPRLPVIECEGFEPGQVGGPKPWEEKG